MLLFGIVAIWDVHKPNLYTCHDAESHVIRLMQYERTLHDGQFPVQWAKTLYGGIGSPVLMLNYQLPYYLASGLHWWGFSTFDSFKLVMALSFLGGGVFMYLVLRRVVRWEIAMAAAVLYMWTPYHFVDLYVRCAFGESVGFLFVPIIILGILESSYVWLILGWAGLFLSHPVMSAGASPLLMGWMAIRHLHLKEKNWAAIRKNCLAYGIAVGIACFNILPMLFLTRYTQYSPYNSGTYDHFVTVRQLLVNTWGYGFSMPGDQDQMSFAIGYISLLVLGGTLTLLLYRRKWKEDAPTWYLFIVLICSFVLTHQVAKPIYELFGLTRYIDFPWRLLMISVIGTPLLLVWIGTHLPKHIVRLTMFILLPLIWVTGRNNIHINATWPFDINYYVTNSSTGDAFGEYASIYRSSHRLGTVSQRLQLIEGVGRIDYITDSTQEVVAQINVKSEEGAVVRYNIMHFPGWTYRIDGYEMSIDKQNCWFSSDMIDDQDYSGLVACKLTSGIHRVVARWVSPRAVRIGNAISLFALASCVGLVVYTYKKSVRQPLKKSSRKNKLQ